MFKGLPKNFDPHDWARKQRDVSGRADIRGFDRLLEAGGKPGDEVSFTMVCDMDEMRAPRCKGTVRATIWAQCQRCLEPLAIEVASDFCWVFLYPSQMEALPDSDYYEKVLITDEGVDLVSLVEDEVLLALPIVPYHDSCEAPRGHRPEKQAKESEADKPNPFAVLEQLKNKF